MLSIGRAVLKADGKDYSVPATGYWDTVSVRPVDDHTVEVTSKKAGKPMSLLAPLVFVLS